ncbi:MAG: hypothetical protein IT472_01305 [Thermomonas sp.]|uniref:hypothetical protein n=1 Tax=Thermomonas sp. TaxID=1971895 RepID=UPI0026357A9E|nr:hypothetical protein [Thermomonas sp.]MCC7095807.1 hypothetical protein [Thermomonas sp.]
MPFVVTPNCIVCKDLSNAGDATAASETTPHADTPTTGVEPTSTKKESAPEGTDSSSSD